MKNHILFLLFLLIPIVGFLSSCKTQKIAYTTDIQSSYKLTESELKKVQFYTSEPIILYVSNFDNKGTEITNGKIVIDASGKYNHIIIPANTPCVLEKKVDENTFILSFEDGPGKHLCFVNNGKVYSLSAKEWNSSNEGLVAYDGRNYFTMSHDAFLKIKLKKLNNVLRSEHSIRKKVIIGS